MEVKGRNRYPCLKILISKSLEKSVFFFSLNFISQRMRKRKRFEDKISKNWAPSKENRVLRGASTTNCSFLYSFFPVLAIRGPNFSRYYRAGRASIRVSTSRFLLRIAHARDRSAHVFSPVFSGMWFQMTNSLRVRSGSKPRDVSRNCLRAQEQFRGPPRVSGNIFPHIYSPLENRSLFLPLSLARLSLPPSQIVAFLSRKRRNRSTSFCLIRSCQTNDSLHSFRLIY